MSANCFKASLASSMTRCSSSVKGWNSRMNDTLSSICSMLDMPLSITITFGSDAVNRTAHEANDASGLARCRISFTGWGGLASLPPFTGSITMTGLPCRVAIS